MCGIVAALGVRDADRAVAAMSRALAHRGPDDDGVSTLVARTGDPVGALAHRRLAILDLSSAGHQPMASAGGRYSLVFNGEIYNFRALRAKLAEAGAQFQSVSDTEVLLEGWARHGCGFIARLEGMFAFSLWDASEETLYLARDLFGIKPLYVAEVGGGVLAASELRALLASGRIERHIDRAALAGYLSFGSVPEPDTLIEGVRMLPAGTVVACRVERGAVQTREVVRFDLPLPAEIITNRAEAAARVRRALEHSVERHLVSDVPVALFLSGGLDSSVVAALAAQRATGPLDGFTVTFSERRFDESAVARALAKRYGIRHHEIPLSGEALLSALPAAFSAMDQPTLDGINTYVVSEAVRAHGSKVVLSGLGGDELFAGYPSFRRARGLARYARMPVPLRRMAASAAMRVGGLRGAKVALGLRRGPPADAAYLASRTLFGERQVVALSGARYASLDPAATGRTLMQQVSWRELTGYMRNTLLRDSDVFSMSHALELRVPFLDREVAVAAFETADALKLSRGVTKPLLVAAARDLLPDEVWNRPKQGFVLPFGDWMRAPLAGEVRDTLGDRDRLQAVGIDATAAGEIWTSFLRGDAGVTWSRPWALYALVRWATLNGAELSRSTGVPVREAAVL
ncbi:MAG TPA: asparagine synthase (glutamine-hydrolyzing) [Gemmatimonadaceae bacterium]|nr:asparagine synthase (glutamine-hydrolyzing) [Gemmatimonadaceae bacterium]